jgi:hypothetical protein
VLQAGLDSLGAVDLRNAIASAFGVDTPATLAFDYPTVAALTGFVVEQTAAAEPAASLHGPADGQEHADAMLSSSPAHALDPDSDGSARRLDPALGAGERLGDPRRLLAEVGALVAAVLGRPVAADQPLMEVRFKPTRH